MNPAQGETIKVWLGAFGEPKPYEPCPGDTWVEATAVCARANGEVFARQHKGPFSAWVPPPYWRKAEA